MWWLKRKLRDQNLSYLPPALRVRKELERAREEIAAAGNEAEVRAIVAGVNAQIRQAIRAALVEGPPSTVMPLDEELTVEEWRTRP